jgi:hypothetical protein
MLPSLVHTLWKLLRMWNVLLKGCWRLGDSYRTTR